ncbi:hypothetical protein HK100_005475 [Physocladia obscura]|uniref:HSF-type DNA-binding domain-containing protein n=1 Tax=Physocladia obscura TaxID=109957 RepID=A0AAD5T8F5_9FUNG|nr:hypothetical protein HK100_005475 [Physocladia obscura]
MNYAADQNMQLSSGLFTQTPDLWAESAASPMPTNSMHHLLVAFDADPFSDSATSPTTLTDTCFRSGSDSTSHVLENIRQLSDSPTLSPSQSKRDRNSEHPSLLRSSSTGSSVSSAASLLMDSIPASNDFDDEFFLTADDASVTIKRRRRSVFVSDFILKLYTYDGYPDHISWCKSGTCFAVNDSIEFGKCFLAKLFKHVNFQSFVRQLNKYDFHKIKVDDSELNLQMPSESLQIFRNLNFLHGKQELLVKIDRKKSSKRTAEAVATTVQFSSEPKIDHLRYPGTVSLKAETKVQNLIAELEEKLAQLTEKRKYTMKGIIQAEERYNSMRDELNDLRKVSCQQGKDLEFLKKWHEIDFGKEK